ncbi:MAG: PD-(D/E)XK nuclease family protein [Actinomycetota bacterium]|nr:PD-(D/E)XK nuclease family protein [Actinomycetota bacterium]
MELTPVQERALRELILPGAARPPPPEVAEGLRARLGEAVGSLELPPALWLSKGRVAEHAACQGLFDATLAGEGPPFEHSVESAAGTLAHRSVYLDLASERVADVRTVVERAAIRLGDTDREFAPYWRGLDELDRAEHVAVASARLALFREAFPPLARSWQPVGEQMLIARVGAGLVLSGRPDLMLGRGARLLLDLKTGAARPVHAEDMRFYALLAALVFRRAPYRVATVFLESMEWQAEDVTEEVLRHAAERVAAAARTASELLSGSRAPELTPGPVCRWCPRSSSCPVSAARPLLATAGRVEPPANGTVSP